jgi:predicted PurR-regulated permease PerM
MSLSPFDEEQNKQAIGAASRMITSVVRGTIFVGLIRFVCIVVAFYLFGIPNAFLWGVLGGIIGMIPGLGVPFAIIPACIYLLFYSHIWLAVGMALFGMAIAFFIDNMLSAYFFGKGTTIQSPFILFSILGGIAFFGPLGFIFGPIVLSLFVSVVDIYKILILKRHIAG